MSTRIKYSKSFTLIELIAVLFIVSIIAGFAVTQYTNLVARSYEKEGIVNLKILFNAQRAYYYENGNYIPASGTESNLSILNSSLKIKIPQSSRLAYSCERIGGSGTSRCFAVYSAGTTTWTLAVLPDVAWQGNLGLINHRNVYCY